MVVCARLLIVFCCFFVDSLFVLSKQWTFDTESYTNVYKYAWNDVRALTNQTMNGDLHRFYKKKTLARNTSINWPGYFFSFNEILWLNGKKPFEINRTEKATHKLFASIAVFIILRSCFCAFSLVKYSLFFSFSFGWCCCVMICLFKSACASWLIFVCIQDSYRQAHFIHQFSFVDTFLLHAQKFVCARADIVIENDYYVFNAHKHTYNNKCIIQTMSMYAVFLHRVEYYIYFILRAPSSLICFN